MKKTVFNINKHEMTQSNIKCIKMTENVSCENSPQQSNTFVKLEDTNTILDYKTAGGGIINWDIASQDILPDPSGRFKIKLNNFPISPENKICVKTKLKGAISTNINIIESRLVETFTNKLNINPDFANIFQLWGNDCLNAKDSTPSFEEIMQLIKDQTNKGDVQSDYYNGLKVALEYTGNLLSVSDIINNTSYYDLKEKKAVTFTKDQWGAFLRQDYSKMPPDTEIKVEARIKGGVKIAKYTGYLATLVSFISSAIGDLENYDNSLKNGIFPFSDTAGEIAGNLAGSAVSTYISATCVSFLIPVVIVTLGAAAVGCAAVGFLGGWVASYLVKKVTKWILTEVITRDNVLGLYNTILNIPTSTQNYVNSAGGELEFIRRMACAFGSCI